MRVTAHQPDFLPWAGFWNKVVSTDALILLDQTDISKGEYHNRVTVDGSWLTLPLVDRATYDTATYDRRDLHKVILTLEHRYLSKKQNPFASRLWPLMDVISAHENLNTTSLVGLNLACMTAIAAILDIELNVHLHAAWCNFDNKTQRLYHSLRCTLPEMTEYYSGAAGENYLEPRKFGVPIKIQTVVNHYGGNSVLQLIARERDPLKLIKECAVWTDFSHRVLRPF